MCCPVTWVKVGNFPLEFILSLKCSQYNSQISSGLYNELNGNSTQETVHSWTISAAMSQLCASPDEFKEKWGALNCVITFFLCAAMLETRRSFGQHKWGKFMLGCVVVWVDCGRFAGAFHQEGKLFFAAVERKINGDKLREFFSGKSYLWRMKFLSSINLLAIKIMRHEIKMA